MRGNTGRNISGPCFLYVLLIIFHACAGLAGATEEVSASLISGCEKLFSLEVEGRFGIIPDTFDRNMIMPGPFHAPSALAFHGGNFYVADPVRGVIVVLGEKGELESTLEVRAEGEIREKGLISSLSAGDDGELYAVDFGTARVLKFERGKTKPLIIGKLGDEKGAFVEPVWASADRKKNLLVFDRYRGMTLCFSPGGRFISEEEGEYHALSRGLLKMTRENEEEWSIEYPAKKAAAVRIKDAFALKFIGEMKNGQPLFLRISAGERNLLSLETLDGKVILKELPSEFGEQLSRRICVSGEGKIFLMTCNARNLSIWRVIE